MKCEGRDALLREKSEEHPLQEKMMEVPNRELVEDQAGETKEKTEPDGQKVS